ncbi:hypothetical protein N8J89_15530 [Crossiella sp. CA-258035]|nr:hypothetical protein [Crossiella sp. CA-258035]WHT22422.1 hypothetical protein N8J89_15530 [Crossiella sp. CA-258035]
MRLTAQRILAEHLRPVREERDRPVNPATGRMSTSTSAGPR